jgi:hypothetical protein
MNRMTQAQTLADRIQQICKSQGRFRALWLVGLPKSGKTTLCREICLQMGWHYVNFTLDPGYLDSLLNKERIYRPEDFLYSLRSWCLTCPSDVLVLDEIEPMLGLWTSTVKKDFFITVSKATRLEKGIVIVTRLYPPQEVAKWVPDNEHIFEVIPGGAL